MPEQDVIVTLNKQNERVRVSQIFRLRNPKNDEYHVLMAYYKNQKKIWLKLYCTKDESERLVSGLREGSVTDLSTYFIEEIPDV